MLDIKTISRTSNSAPTPDVKSKAPSGKGIDPLRRVRPMVMWGLKERFSRGNPLSSRACCRRVCAWSRNLTSPSMPSHRTRGLPDLGKAPNRPVASLNFGEATATPSSIWESAGSRVSSTSPRKASVKCAVWGSTHLIPVGTKAFSRSTWVAIRSFTFAGSSMAMKVRMTPDLAL